MKEKQFISSMFAVLVAVLFLFGFVLAQEPVPPDTTAQPEEPVIEEVIPEEEEVAEEAPAEEVVKEEPSKFKPGWIAKAYINGGVMEPGQAPNKKGTGTIFNTGMRIQGGAQLNIGNWVKLPLILQPLTAEVMVGLGMWNAQPQYENYYKDAKHQVISVLALGRYDLTDLLMKAIGFENPALGFFATVGFQYNMHSWDFPNWNREFDNVSSFGIAYGAGVKYNLQNLVGKPVEIDLRFTQGLFILGKVKDTSGVPFFDETYYPTFDVDSRDYGHLEYGLMLGIGYPF